MRGKALPAGWIAALIAGFLLRVFFVLHHPRILGDPLVYGDLAHNMLRHHIYGLTEDHVRSTLIRLPGYPLFLAGCFAVFGDGNYIAVLWVQVVVDLCGWALLGMLAARMFGARAGLAAVWVSALCPFTANYAAAALAETCSIFCVTVALWGLARWYEKMRAGERGFGWALVIGLALMWATLLRPDGGLLAAAVVPAMVWAGWGFPQRRGSLHYVDDKIVRSGRDETTAATAGRKRIPCGNGKKKSKDGNPRGTAVTGAVIASAVLCAALGLWAARNWRVFHVFQPLAPKYANDPGEAVPLGFARWYRTWAIGFGDSVNVYWTYDGSPLNLGDLPRRAFDSAEQKRETARLYAKYNDLQSATPEIDAAFARLAAERVRAHPVRYYVLLPLAKLADMWLRPRTELMKMPVDWWDVRLHPRRSAFEMAYAGLNVALLVLACVGLWRWRRMGWVGYAPVAVAGVVFVVLRSAMLLTIDNSEPRYTLECYPVVLLLASLAVAQGTRLWSTQPQRQA